MKTWPFLFLLLSSLALSAQPKLLDLQWADSLHRPRTRLLLTGGAVAYPAAMAGLWKAWYADYPLGRFHFFNDMSEWNQMDKAGHLFSSYQEARLGWNVSRWAGFSDRKASWIGFGLAQLVQTSFEVMDGFSEQWGFSLWDVAFNTVGTSAFTFQQLAWKEQRVLFKMSAQPVQHAEELIYPYRGTGPPVRLSDRSADLYGTGAVSLFLKNYNALVIWSSINPASFCEQRPDWLPAWLNVAVGMGANNMYAGVGYEWQLDKNCQGFDCAAYRVDPLQYPRSRQWLLSLDVDLSRLPVRNKTLRTLLSAINTFKIPAPTLEWDGRGYWKMHPVYF